MSNLISIIEKMSSKLNIAIILVLYVLVFGAILLTLGQLSQVSGGYGILDFELGYSTEKVTQILGSYGDAGMALYTRIQVLDIFNPALYSLIASIFTYLIWKGRGPNFLCLFPFLGGIGDYAENLTLFLLSRSFPAVSEGLVATSSVLSLIKNALLMIGMLPLIVGLILLCARLLSSKLK